MIQVECTNLNDLVVNGLPDGSKVILDSKSEKVFALNPTAGAAWDACSGPADSGDQICKCLQVIKSEQTEA